MNTVFKPIVHEHNQVSALLSTIPRMVKEEAISIEALNPKTLGAGSQDVVLVCDATGYTDALVQAFKGFKGLFTGYEPLTAFEAVSEINRTIKPGAITFKLLPINPDIDQQEFIEALHAVAVNSPNKRLQLVTLSYLTELSENDKAFLCNLNA